MEFNVQIPADIEKGEYKIIVTLVAEGCFWFDDKDICFDRGILLI